MSEDGDLPEGWEWRPFREVATVASNLVDPTLTPDAIHIAPNHIESWSGRLIDRGTVAGDDVKSAKHAFRPGQLLYSKIRPYLAKATLVDFPGVCSADMYPIDVDAEQLDARWLLSWMLTPQFTEAASGRQGRTVLPKINQDALNELLVPVAPLDVQRGTVAKLDALRARSRRAKEALDAVPALLDKLRQSILAAAFRGDLTADWREANPDVEPASELLKRIRVERRTRLSMGGKRGREFADSPDAGGHDAWFGDPEARGWFLESLDNLCDPVRGIPYGIVQTGEPDPDGVPTVRCGDIKGFEIARAGLKRVRASIERGYERTRLAGGEVLLAIRGTVGQTAVAGPELRGANISREVAMIPLLGGIEPSFVMYLLASPAGQAMLGQHVKGVAQAGINLADLRALRVPIPSQAEQARVVAQVERGLSLVTRMQRRTLEVGSESAELDRALLSAAFRGELLDRQNSPGVGV